MNIELIYDALESLGLKRLDCQLYVFLAKNGPHKCHDLCQSFGLAKQQVYPSLKRLREKTVVTFSFDRPAIIFAKPFEIVLNLLIQSKVQEAEKTLDNKDQILRAWQLMLEGEFTI
ncbi:MAG TPA: helix-turn-helix domain-containing protein [Candidatus Nanoarchaeia archaeon]|nr:helix-turn-helix domain-containing protein [Candidatus Nanoarchaeia archaeon]